ncbi:MAG: indole-3-glycerol phosphate synthase TrpC [Myxococcota bacterium]
MSILDEIVSRKKREVAEARERVPPEVLERVARERREPLRDLRGALRAEKGVPVIAEIKRRSPSRGEIRPDFDPVACARAYAEAGATALSVLTDAHYFGGELAFLEAIRPVAPLPLLRKDFVVDAYQVHESCAAGADAILLIVAALPLESLAELFERAREVGLAALVEVHDEAELETALGIGADLVGINHRDLRTFEVDLGRTARLAPRVPDGVILVAESGIFTHDQVQELRAAGAHAFLVGESLMREQDMGSALRRLRGAP